MALSAWSKVAIGVGVGVVIGVGLTFYQPEWLLDGVARLTPGVVWFGPPDPHIIALTFDDGPDPRWTPQVLELLRQAGVPATFFLIGEHAAAHPELVRRIVREGHQVGNHMWRDENALLLGDDAAERSLRRTERVLFAITGAAPDWMRPAGGLARPSFVRRAHRLGYRVVIASAYASDPRRPPARYIAWALTRMMRPGAILVLHDSGGDRSRSVAALPAILDYARRHNYRCVTLDEMFGKR
jgi:peptidoglycan/xylan/chitin deacetylase (PgdA/CDA1 family)